MQPRFPFVLGLALSFGLAGGVFADSKAEQAQHAEQSGKNKDRDKDSDNKKKDVEASDVHTSAIPAGFKGFDGTIGGKVVSVPDDGAELVLHVNKVWHVNTRSTASNADSIIGKTVTILPDQNKKDGKTYDSERNKAWFRSLKVGEVIQVDCGMSKGQLRVNDMTKDERKDANKELKKDAKADKKKD
jgi:hypothetical protein